MKKFWEKPLMLVEGFTPNEYVAACWYVQCDVNAANEVEKIMKPTNPNNYGTNNFDDGQTHASEQCGTSGNQVIVTNDKNVAIGMYEINSQTGVKELACTLYTDSSYKNGESYSNVDIGERIYWTTRVSSGTTWYHQGLVNGVNPAHPNRS